MNSIHPYWGQDFIGFFVVLFSRIFSFFTGQGGEITIDEAQILILGLTGVTMSLVGSLLVYRRMTMLANSISHTILLGIVVTYLFGLWLFPGVHDLHLQPSMAMLIGASFCTSLLTTASTNFFIRVLRVQKDASIGIVFTTFLALGIIFITIFTKNAHIGTELILGNIDLLHKGDIGVAFWLALSTLGLIYLFYRPFLMTTLDAPFAQSIRISLNVYDQAIMFITSAAIISSFRLVGVALVLALLVLPPMIARLLTHRFHIMMMVAVLINFLVALLSVALTRTYLSVYGVPLSTSGMMVCLLFFTYLTLAFIQRRRKKVACLTPSSYTRKLEAAE